MPLSRTPSLLTLPLCCVQISRDEQTILIVSYADLKACAERSFGELLQQGNYAQAGRYVDQTQYTSLDFGGGLGGMRPYQLDMPPEAQWAAPQAGRGGGRPR